jgi:hypothetical protein
MVAVIVARAAVVRPAIVHATATLAVSAAVVAPR